MGIIQKMKMKFILLIVLLVGLTKFAIADLSLGGSQILGGVDITPAGTLADDSINIKYQNITNLPTCAGTDKLTYDGSILSCDTDQSGAGGEISNSSLYIEFTTSGNVTWIYNYTTIMEAWVQANYDTYNYNMTIISLFDYNHTSITQSWVQTNYDTFNYNMTIDETDPIFTAENTSLWAEAFDKYNVSYHNLLIYGYNETTIVQAWVQANYDTYNYNMSDGTGGDISNSSLFTEFTTSGNVTYIYNHTSVLIALYGDNWYNHTNILTTAYLNLWYNYSTIDQAYAGKFNESTYADKFNETYFGSSNITINASRAIMFAGSVAGGSSEVGNQSIVLRNGSNSLFGDWSNPGINVTFGSINVTEQAGLVSDSVLELSSPQTNITANLTLGGGSSSFFDNGTCTIWKRSDSQIALCD